MGTLTPVEKIIIVGAGPSGLLLGILLAEEGIKVQILEASIGLDKNPRAAHYAPSAVYERAGVLEEVKAKGIHPDAVCQRHPNGTFIAGIRSRWTSNIPWSVFLWINWTSSSFATSLVGRTPKFRGNIR
ncbi:hypothetical protein A1O1_03269 [Capronia coronata CBS 617.96]|uniref:FAD-binding domain-containing protein n=1 Tax=Capronia coronata CBS 617.96 TaxID=1182541 RepID=W9Z004_9EURO|nr:uncharacterized protein A1O1_03269 [Capronia coronata CBS 617.96]EXJ94871.1 hypothetical protein A1O1_03269 [Capronia coronata CBS 617.96]